MRVAYVCTDVGVPVFGRKGASVHVQAVIRALVRDGAEVHLLAARLGGAPPDDLAEVQVHTLPVERSDDPADDEAAAQRADAAARTVLDGLHEEAGIDLVYERYSLWGRTGTAWATRHGVPSLLEVNAPLIDEQATHRILHDRPAAEAVAVQAFSAGSAIVCVSEGVAAWARSRSNDPSRVHVLTNGVDTSRVRPSGRPAAPASGTPFTVGFVGTLKPWHGVETLIEAVADLAAFDPSYRLLLVGDGPQARSLREQAERAGISHAVRMTGSIDPADVPDLLASMDVAVAPYPALKDFYFSPLKVTEYLAAGLPTVASRIGPLPELLDQGRAGVLVPPGDPVALAAAIRALRADPARRDALSVTGRHRAVSGYEWSSVVARALALVALDRDRDRDLTLDLDLDRLPEVAHGRA